MAGKKNERERDGGRRGLFLQFYIHSCTILTLFLKYALYHLKNRVQHSPKIQILHGQGQPRRRTNGLLPLVIDLIVLLVVVPVCILPPRVPKQRVPNIIKHILGRVIPNRTRLTRRLLEIPEH